MESAGRLVSISMMTQAKSKPGTSFKPFLIFKVDFGEECQYCKSWYALKYSACKYLPFTRSSPQPLIVTALKNKIVDFHKECLKQER